MRHLSAWGGHSGARRVSRHSTVDDAARVPDVGYVGGTASQGGGPTKPGPNLTSYARSRLRVLRHTIHPNNPPGPHRGRRIVWMVIHVIGRRSPTSPYAPNPQAHMTSKQMHPAG